MSEEYKVKGREVVYGAAITRSRFTDEEWEAIYKETVKLNFPEEYEKYKDDNKVIEFIAEYVDIRDRYKLLLELLPQDSFSYAGTHPKWVADEIDYKMINRMTIQDDLLMFIEGSEDLEDLKNVIKEYAENILD